VAETQHGVLGKGLEGHSNEREQVGDGNGAAFFFGAGPLLDEGVHRDDKKTSRDPEESKLNEDCQIADTWPGKQRSHQEDAA
jgi:hypothetical protein